MALLPCCFQHRTSHSRSYSHLHTFLLYGEKNKLERGGSHHIFRQKGVNELYLVVGELHHPKRPQPATSPRWLIVPERGLFTGIAIFGAVGSGKTTGCMYPFAEQVFAYSCC